MFCIIKSGCPNNSFAHFLCHFFYHCSLFICWHCLHIAYALLYIMFNIQMLSRKYIFAQLQCATTTTTSKMCVFSLPFSLCDFFHFFDDGAWAWAHTLFFVVVVVVWHFAQGKMNNKKSERKVLVRVGKSKNTCTKLTHTRTHEQFSRNVYLVNKFCIKREICVLWWRKERTTKTELKTVVRWGKNGLAGRKEQIVRHGEKNRLWNVHHKMLHKFSIVVCASSELSMGWDGTMAVAGRAHHKWNATTD